MQPAQQWGRIRRDGHDVVLSQVDALRAQLQQARVSGSPESGLAPGGMSAGASAASAMAVPTAELKANLSTAAWALPPAMPPTLVAPSQVGKGWVSGCRGGKSTGMATSMLCVNDTYVSGQIDAPGLNQQAPRFGPREH